MSVYLGIDTSNYTTSVALYDSKDGLIVSKRQLLPVKEGEKGIRQSDAVFHHTRQLPLLLEEALEGNDHNIKAVGVSCAPRTAEGSYMPCFGAGASAARVISCVTKAPLYKFSHQQGHIAAALYSLDRLDLVFKKHIAFHVSGGTTEALLVNFSESFLSCETAAKTLDLNAGQLIDRVGVMLGLSFPCGKELEKLALKCDEKIIVKPTMKGNDCCLSGSENICRKLYESGAEPSYVAKYAIEYVLSAVAAMAKNLVSLYPGIPLVFAGGVMSNSIIRERITSKLDCMFSLPEFSTDNAVGIAALASIKDNL